MVVVCLLVHLVQIEGGQWFLEVVVVVGWFCIGDLVPNLVPSLGTVEVVVLGVQCWLDQAMDFVEVMG